MSRAARKWLTGCKGKGLSQLTVCFQGIAKVKERVEAVASCQGFSESGRHEGRGRGCHELMCAVRKRQKRKKRGEELRAALGCQIREVKGLSQFVGVCQG